MRHGYQPTKTGSPKPPTTGSGVKPPRRSWFDRPMAPDDNRPPRGRWAAGMYTCVCTGCERAFAGDKRASECAECAYARPEPVPRPEVPSDEYKRGYNQAVQDAIGAAWFAGHQDAASAIEGLRKP